MRADLACDFLPDLSAKARAAAFVDTRPPKPTFQISDKCDSLEPRRPRSRPSHCPHSRSCRHKASPNFAEADKRRAAGNGALPLLTATQPAPVVTTDRDEEALQEATLSFPNR